MSVRLYHIDAFTDSPFSGNPAAVCLMENSPGDSWLQSVAAEMNLSETAFVWRERDVFRLRWFTPTVEVDLCGHATLAAAHALWQEAWLAENLSISFETRSGLLMARKSGEWIDLDFPAEPAESCPSPEGLLPALGVEALYTGRNRMDYLVLVETEEEVRFLQPDMGLLASVETRGVIVTAPSNSEDYDFVSRFFAPAAGIDEDPVTGSAHCCLGPFWAERLGEKEMVGRQISSRGGIVRVRLEGERVFLSGQAATVFKGELIAE